MSTAASPAELTPAPPAKARRLPRIELVRPEREPDARIRVASYALMLLAVIVLTVIANLTVVGRIQHFTAQHRLYSQLRLSLADGSAPLGQLDVNNAPVKPGTPIALLEIPKLGLREVVVEGTASRQTKLGVGHRRDTPLPGQPGVSVLMGRAAAYGGPFAHLKDLQAGDSFTVTTGQGVAQYQVIGARVGSTRLPVLGPNDGRLTLITATGSPFEVRGVLRVDAKLISPAFVRPPAAFAQGLVDPSEEALAGDHSELFALSWLLELLVVVAIVAVWSWKRWGHLATWLVFAPLLLVIALACSDRACDLLPNLM